MGTKWWWVLRTSITKFTNIFPNPDKFCKSSLVTLKSSTARHDFDVIGGKSQGQFCTSCYGSYVPQNPWDPVILFWNKAKTANLVLMTQRDFWGYQPGALINNNLIVQCYTYTIVNKLSALLAAWYPPYLRELCCKDPGFIYFSRMRCQPAWFIIRYSCGGQFQPFGLCFISDHSSLPYTIANLFREVSVTETCIEICCPRRSA